MAASSKTQSNPKTQAARKSVHTKAPLKHSRSEELLLKQIGLLIHKNLFDRGKPVEWLSFKSGIARSSIREIIAGRSNTRILTLNTLAKNLGFSDVVEMLIKARNKNGN